MNTKANVGTVKATIDCLIGRRLELFCITTFRQWVDVPSIKGTYCYLHWLMLHRVRSNDPLLFKERLKNFGWRPIDLFWSRGIFLITMLILAVDILIYLKKISKLVCNHSRNVVSRIRLTVHSRLETFNPLSSTTSFTILPTIMW